MGMASTIIGGSISSKRERYCLQAVDCFLSSSTHHWYKSYFLEGIQNLFHLLSPMGGIHYVFVKDLVVSDPSLVHTCFLSIRERFFPTGFFSSIHIMRNL